MSLLKDKKIRIYDTTLREGSQRVGISFSVGDKVALCLLLDRLGVDFIEGGFPGGSPKDQAFYEKMKGNPLTHAALVAFGPTVKPGVSVEEDPMLKALAEVETGAVAILGKASLFQVEKVLDTTAEENLRMIRETVAYFKKLGRTVFFDAEHFFDGFRENPEYAVSCLKEAKNAGAERLVLCDTNGGTLPFEISDTIGTIASEQPDLFPLLGIHTHNDSGTADYSAVAAALCGVDLVQVAVSGWGERCGNANLFTVVPDLQLKLGANCLPDLSLLREAALAAAELANVKTNDFDPFVGKNAFAHKAGIHVSAVCRDTSSYEHVDPALVGNDRDFRLSEQSGRAAVLAKIHQMLPDLNLNTEQTSYITGKIKELELQGYRFEGADASFEMLVKDLLNIRKHWFLLNNYKVVVFNEAEEGKPSASAIVDVTVDDREEITAANGLGPVDALDNALRKALASFYPAIGSMFLVDYKVRVLESKLATASVVRVVVESSDGSSNWCTVGVSQDIIKASFNALVDSYEYMLDNSPAK